MLLVAHSKLNSLHYKSLLPSQVRVLMKERDHAKKEINSTSPAVRLIQLHKYKTLRNRVVTLIRRQRSEQVEKELQTGKHPWKVANQALGRTTKENDIRLTENGQELSTDEEKANLLNNFFIDKVTTLQSKINPKLKTDPLQKLKKVSSKFSFTRVSNRDVLKTISAMKSSKCSGLDGITSELLKLIKIEVAPILTEIINTSLREGNFPTAYKCAVITPIYKNKGSRLDKSNYRPISGLSVFGKCLECIVDAQLRRYFEQHKLLGQNQHGFRKNRSTSTALITTVVKLREAKDKKLYSGLLLFDLSAAYDVLDTNILLKKCEQYGLDTTTLSWLRSYLSERYQAVKVGTFMAEPLPLPCGIPQGSACSCLLFIVYIADIGEWTSISLQGYADDTLTYCHGSSATNVINTLQEEAKKILTFFASNNLVANPSKTAFLLIRPTTKGKDSKEVVKVGDEEIKESESERVLGVQLSNNLEWKTHIDKVNERMSMGIYTLKRLQPLLSTKHLQNIAEGLIMSHTRYCAPVYLSGKVRTKENETQGQDMKKLQTQQNNALRIALKKNRRDHIKIADMLEATGSLSVNQMVCYSTLIETWKSNNITGILPVSKRRQDDRTLRSDSDNLFHTGTINSKCFLFQASRLWNLSTQRFRTTNLLTIAKAEAKALAKSLPI